MIRELAAISKNQTDVVLLIRRIREGDAVAFGILYDRFAPVLLGIIRKQITDLRQSEEILQKIFLRVHSEIASFDISRDRLFSWLLAITHNIISKNSAEIPAAGNFVSSHNASAPGAGESTPQDPFLLLDMFIRQGYTFAQAAQKMSLSPRELKLKLKAEFKQLRSMRSND